VGSEPSIHFRLGDCNIHVARSNQNLLPAVLQCLEINVDHRESVQQQMLRQVHSLTFNLKNIFFFIIILRTASVATCNNVYSVHHLIQNYYTYNHAKVLIIHTIKLHIFQLIVVSCVLQYRFKLLSLHSFV
jgi:hypothetical protein